MKSKEGERERVIDASFDDESGDQRKSLPSRIGRYLEGTGFPFTFTRFVSGLLMIPKQTWYSIRHRLSFCLQRKEREVFNNKRYRRGWSPDQNNSISFSVVFSFHLQKLHVVQPLKVSFPFCQDFSLLFCLLFSLSKPDVMREGDKEEKRKESQR